MSSLFRLLRRKPVHGWDVAITKWRSRVLGLVQHRWIALTGSTIVSHVSLFGVLLLSLRVMGIPDSEVGWAQALAVFAFARLLTAIPLTPGGVGVVELALIAGLSQGSGDDGRVVAAVLMFRLLTYVLPVVIGACTYLIWRRNRSWRDSAPPLTATGDIVSDQERRRRYAASYVVTGHKALTRRASLLGLLAGLAAFGGSALLAKQGLAPGEESTFVAINALPDSLYLAIWPFMQYGVFLTIPVLTGVALLLRRIRLAITMAIAGIGVYLLARIIKEVAKRGRPEALFDSVEARETFASGSLGFPSGHAAVAAALTVVVTPHLRGRWRVVPAALLVIVCIGRIYVGAHAPLDLIGGAALGASAGFAANLLIGTTSKPTTDTNAIQAVPEVPIGREHEIAAPVAQRR